MRELAGVVVHSKVDFCGRSNPDLRLRAEDAKDSQNRPEETTIEFRNFSVTGSGFVIAKLEDRPAR